MKLQFTPLTIASKELIQRYTLTGSRRNCDLSFANLFCWHFLYQTTYAEMGDFLLFRFYAGHHLAYMQPVYARMGGDDFCGKEKEDIWSELPQEAWQPVVEAMMQDAQALNAPFLMLGVSEGLRLQLEQCFPTHFHIAADRDYADYIYERLPLQTLQGKHLQPKRNHINRFLHRYASYRYLPLTAEWIPECRRLLDEWDYRQEAVNRTSIKAEHRAIELAFSHFEELDLMGGVLFVDERLVAFTYGAAINFDTFDVCVEKADSSIEGAYTLINREFVSHLPAQYRYINREEDLGIEGLRRSKLSYHPYCILPKYAVRDTYQLIHRREETRRLWKSCFGDSEAFLDLYFGSKYKDEENKTITRDGQIVAALQTLSYSFNYHTRALPMGYISGACTDVAYRNRHLMSDLLRQAHQDMYQRGDVFAALIPAEPWLFDFYGRFGYQRLFYKGYTLINAGECMGKKLSDASLEWYEHKLPMSVWQSASVYVQEQMAHRCWAVQHNSTDLDVVRDDLFLSGGAVAVAYEANQIVGVFFGKRQEGIWLIDDFFYTGDDNKLSFYLHQIAVSSLCTFLKLPRFEASDECLGQLRVLNVFQALSAFASVYPMFKGLIGVTGDETLPENNQLYFIADGHCVIDHAKSNGLADEIQWITISKLVDFIFQGAHPWMSMMLN